MAAIFPSPNTYNDVYSRVRRNHLQYFCEEHLKDRVKYRDKLESSIREYLSVVNHCNKFYFHETADVLRNSAQSDNFNVFKVQNAWEAISNYARNLYIQPWREEYREIRLYSGFYKHQIEPHLLGVEAMFELMGYKRVDHKLILENEISEDCLCRTSLDALVAMCECQILCNVYEEVIKRIPNCTWFNILNFRERYTASTEDTIQGIIALYHAPRNCCIDCCPPTDFMYPSNFQSGYHGYSDSAMKVAYSPSYGYSNYLRSIPSYQHQDNRLVYANGHCGHVPTAKLLELDDPLESTRSHHRNKVDKWLQNDFSRFSDNFSSNSSVAFEGEIPRKPVKTENKSSKKSWDHSLDKLDKEKNKSDHGIRSFLPKSSSKSNKVVESLNKLTVSSNSDSRFDTVDGRKHSDVPSKPNSLKLFKLSKSDHINKKEKSPTWGCESCTFHNSISRDVCEMCGKSRIQCSETPLERGGKQCEQCTLVNKKEAEKCEACDNNLENSSTYV